MWITCDHALMLAIVDILRKFNPGLYGGSPGGTVSDSRGSMQAPSSQLVVSQCKAQQPCDNRLFNGAVTGAVANDIPGQLANLTKVLQADPNIDFENDWKVITLWIGGNDLCRYGTACAALCPDSCHGYSITAQLMQQHLDQPTCRVRCQDRGGSGSARGNCMWRRELEHGYIWLTCLTA